MRSGPGVQTTSPVSQNSVKSHCRRSSTCRPPAFANTTPSRKPSPSDAATCLGSTVLQAPVATQQPMDEPALEGGVYPLELGLAPEELHRVDESPSSSIHAKGGRRRRAARTSFPWARGQPAPTA